MIDNCLNFKDPIAYESIINKVNEGLKCIASNAPKYMSLYIFELLYLVKTGYPSSLYYVYSFTLSFTIMQICHPYEHMYMCI